MTRELSSSESAHSFDLNIEKILEGWENSHAVRELIANALDEQALTQTKAIEIGQREGKWSIRDYGRGLRYQHLTQNENQEKLAHSEQVIGKFGVGLKDALATLNRRGVQIEIRSRYGNIVLDQMPKHGFDDVITLHAIISPATDPNFIGTEILLDGLTNKEINEAKSFFLKFSGDAELEKTQYGTILKKPSRRPGRIYVTGLLVAEEENFAFFYNITALTKQMRNALNRERTNVGRNAYRDRVKDMLLEAESPAVADILVSELANIERGNNADEVDWKDVAIHAVRILNARDKVMVVSPSELLDHVDTIEYARSDGVRIIVVPNSIRDSLVGVTDIGGNPVRDIGVYQAEWNQSFRFEFVDYRALNRNERVIFDSWRQIAALAGGMPKAVAEIKITETMRPDLVFADHTQGLWEPASRFIIIRRDQLRSIANFAGTLLHEMIHAGTGYSDITRDFENALTDMLGRIATTRVQPKRRWF